MFNKTIVVPVRTSTNYVPYDKTVTHNYAPTSEQARHLEALQKQAWETVTDHIVHQIDGNQFTCVEIHTAHDVAQMEEATCALFKLNGKKFDVKIATKSSAANKHEFYQAIAEALSQEITQQLMTSLFNPPTPTV